MVVIITGGSSGIGLATARLYRDLGHTVYSISRRSFNEEGINHVIGDVCDFESIKQAIDSIFEKEGRIDILINNAGMGISGAIEDTLLEDAEYNFKVNFFGTFNTTKAVIPIMRNQGGGKIANISSAAAIFPLPFQAFYSATKSAINSFSEALNIEVAPFNIQVCIFLPGDIKTDFTHNRKKNQIESKHYGERIQKSVAVMEKDEQNGMSPDNAAKVIYNTLKKRRLPLYKVIGTKYKLFGFFAKLLPVRIKHFALRKLYGFVPKNK